MWQGDFCGHAPFAHAQIKVVGAAGQHAHHRFAWPGFRARHVLKAQNFRPALLMEHDCFNHCCHLSSSVGDSAMLRPFFADKGALAFLYCF
jgi:hypothetical protein